MELTNKFFYHAISNLADEVPQPVNNNGIQHSLDSKPPIADKKPHAEPYEQQNARKDTNTNSQMYSIASDIMLFYSQRYHNGKRD